MISLKKPVKIAIIASIAAVVIISALAVTVHLKLSAIEGSETRQETASEKINEAINVITNPEHNEPSEANESAEQLEKEGNLCQGTKRCITGTVEKIVDGDTIYVNGEKIRLSLTNTPEKNEDGYSEATLFTSTLCPVGSTVTVDQDDKQPYDVYDRLLGKVFCGNKMLNEELLIAHHADILTQYCSKSEYANEPWARQFGC